MTLNWPKLIYCIQRLQIGPLNWLIWNYLGQLNQARKRRWLLIKTESHNGLPLHCPCGNSTLLWMLLTVLKKHENKKFVSKKKSRLKTLYLEELSSIEDAYVYIKGWSDWAQFFSFWEKKISWCNYIKQWVVSLRCSFTATFCNQINLWGGLMHMP